MEDPCTIVSDNSSASDSDEITDNSLRQKPNFQNLLKPTAFDGVWSIEIPSDKVSPPPRSSQFSVYASYINEMIIGYGSGKDEKFLNDIWRLSLKTNKWSQVPIDTSSIGARCGAVGARIGDKVWIFGGICDQSYVSDLHIIDLSSNTVSRPQICGASPPGRIGHVFSSHEPSKVLLWGGYNGDWLRDCWILDTESLSWREVPSEIRGRTSAAFCTVEDYVYIFGATKSSPLIRFDWKTESFETVATTGFEPPSEVIAATLLSVEGYLILIGGQLPKKKYTLVYACDLASGRWSVLSITPDSITTSLSDGFVDSEGMFMIPRTAHSSSAYDRSRRRIFLSLGHPRVDPPCIYSISVAEALGDLHIQTDLLAALRG